MKNKNKILLFNLVTALYERQINEYDKSNFTVNKHFNDMQVEIVLDFYKKFSPDKSITDDNAILMHMAYHSNILEILRKEFDDLPDEEISSWTVKDVPRLINIIKSKVKFN